jgi:spore coat polysaccharide biosynthesis protein SpsF
VEVVRFAALERAWNEAKEPHQREHVLPYLYEIPGRFRTFILDNDIDLGSLRWTVDTPQDLELVQQVFAHFAPRTNFTWRDVLALFDLHPELAALNAGTPHKSYLDVDKRHQFKK